MQWVGVTQAVTKCVAAYFIFDGIQVQVCELLLSELTCAVIPFMSSWRFISACMYTYGYVVNS